MDYRVKQSSTDGLRFSNCNRGEDDLTGIHKPSAVKCSGKTSHFLDIHTEHLSR